jgi:tellurite resistance protein TerC
MSTVQIAYTVFGAIILLALVFDLGLLSQNHKKVSIRMALYQTLFWVGLSVLFFAFLWWDESQSAALKFITAYLMEWSLSIDNIFVFILIFSFFKVNELDAGRALLTGILLAIIFRIAFIAAGIELINHFNWVMYLFGAFLLYTGFRLFFQKEDADYDPSKTKIYQLATKFLRLSKQEPNGRYIIRRNKKIYFTTLALVVLMLAATDIVFALDSIPTVVSLVRDNPKTPFSSSDILVIYSSNIFAVLGLRSLFFLLQGAVNKFDYLQQGIAIVLIFIGVKMLAEFFNIHIPIYISLGVIVLCLGGSIAYSLKYDKAPGTKQQEDHKKDKG